MSPGASSFLLKELLSRSLSLLPLLVDEKFTSYLSAPYAGGSAGAPPSFGATEGNQPARAVYVQAPCQVRFYLSNVQLRRVSRHYVCVYKYIYLVLLQPGSPAKDYFGLSLFTLLCCFWPLGLVALIKSVEVRVCPCLILNIILHILLQYCLLLLMQLMNKYYSII